MTEKVSNMYIKLGYDKDSEYNKGVLEMAKSMLEFWDIHTKSGLWRVDIQMIAERCLKPEKKMPDLDFLKEE